MYSKDKSRHHKKRQPCLTVETGWVRYCSAIASWPHRLRFLFAYLLCWFTPLRQWDRTKQLPSLWCYWASNNEAADSNNSRGLLGLGLCITTVTRRASINLECCNQCQTLWIVSFCSSTLLLALLHHQPQSCQERERTNQRFNERSQKQPIEAYWPLTSLTRLKANLYCMLGKFSQNARHNFVLKVDISP